MNDYSSFSTAFTAVTNPMTPAAELQAVAQAQPTLWPRIAAHPNASPELLNWLGSAGDDSVRRAIASRTGGEAPAAPAPAPAPAPMAAPAPMPAPAPAPMAAPAPAPMAAPAPAPAPYGAAPSMPAPAAYGAAMAAPVPGAPAPYGGPAPAGPSYPGQPGPAGYTPDGYGPAGYGMAGPMGMTPPPKKGKGGLIALIVALAVLLAGGGGGWYAASNWSIKTMSIAFTGGSAESLTMTVGDTMTGTVTVTPAKPLHDSYTYTSSSSSVLSVTQDGATITIKALKPGSATITGATANSKGKPKPITTTTKVTILQPATDITGLPESIGVEEGATAQVTATVVPADSTDVVKYSIDDESVATVDKDGLVSGIAAGTATLTVTAGSITKTVPVTVIAPITWDRASVKETIEPASAIGRPWLPSRPVHNCTGFSLSFSLDTVVPADYTSDLENIDWIVWAYGPRGWENVASFQYGSLNSVYSGDITFPAMDITKLYFAPSNAPSRVTGWSFSISIEGTKAA